MFHIKARTWERLSEDRHYVGANDTVIMIHGEEESEFFTDGDRKKKVVVQVGRVLICADKLAQTDKKLTLTRGDVVQEVIFK